MEGHTFFCQQGREEGSHRLRLGVDEGDFRRGNPGVQPDADLFNGLAQQVEGALDEAPLECSRMIFQIQRSLEQGLQRG